MAHYGDPSINPDFLILAIADAFHDARLLHQDISIGNVMLTEERSNGTRPTGILNDWDRAQELGSLTRDHRRVRYSLFDKLRVPSNTIIGHMAVPLRGPTARWG